MGWFDYFKRDKQSGAVQFRDADLFGRGVTELDIKEPREIEIVHLDPVGSSGTELTGSVLNEEFLKTLIGTEAADIWDKMRRSDAKIAMILSAVKSPIKRAEFKIQSFDRDNPEMVRHAELVSHCIFDAMDKRWTTTLNEILSLVDFGYSLFERVHENVIGDPRFGNFTRLKTLAFRSQRTIDFWNVNQFTGELESVRQLSFGDAQNTDALLPAKFLNIFTLNKEGDNYEGISMLRPAYGAWLRKRTYQKLMAIGIEKFAVPTPTLKVPKGKESSTEFTTAKKVLKRYVSHQQQYITMPAGWDIEFTQTNFDAGKVQLAIDAENTEMVNASLANFLELGQSGSGSYALSTDLSDFFLSSLDYISSGIICEEFNDSIIPELVDLNFGKQVDYPFMTCTGITDKMGKELAEVLAALGKTKYIIPDDALEADLRRRLKLPEVSEEGQREVQSGGGMGQGQTPEFSEKKNLELAETPRGQITRVSEEIRALMREEITRIGFVLAKEVSGRFGKFPPSEQHRAIANQRAKGTEEYRLKLQSIFIDEADKAIKDARTEIPGGSKIKFAESDDLPPSVLKNVSLQSSLLVSTQMADLEKAVFFQFTHSFKSTNDPDLLQKDLDSAVVDFAKSASVTAAAGNTVGLIVNDARNAFFFQTDAFEEIDAFRFLNPNPISPICKDLQNRVFAKNDPEAQRFFPPLHHNCKSYLQPIIKSKKTVKIDDRGLKPSSPRLEKFITLGEHTKFGVYDDRDRKTADHNPEDCPEVKDRITLQDRVLQTVVISKDIAPNRSAAIAEAKKFQAKIGKIDETSTSFRFRQRPPSDFVSGSFRTFKPKEGVAMVFGQLK